MKTLVTHHVTMDISNLKHIVSVRDYFVKRNKLTHFKHVQIHVQSALQVQFARNVIRVMDWEMTNAFLVPQELIWLLEVVSVFNFIGGFFKYFPLVCPSNCATCTSSTSCQSCTNGAYLYNSKCPTTCPDGYFGSGTFCMSKEGIEDRFFNP